MIGRRSRSSVSLSKMLGIRGFRFGNPLGFGDFGLWNICIDLSCQHSMFQVAKHFGFQISYQGSSTCISRFSPVRWHLSGKRSNSDGNKLLLHPPHFFSFIWAVLKHTWLFMKWFTLFPLKTLLATTWWLGFWWIWLRRNIAIQDSNFIAKVMMIYAGRIFH